MELSDKFEISVDHLGVVEFAPGSFFEARSARGRVVSVGGVASTGSDERTFVRWTHLDGTTWWEELIGSNAKGHKLIQVNTLDAYSSSTTAERIKQRTGSAKLAALSVSLW